jgi:hypothetical protein
MGWAWAIAVIVLAVLVFLYFYRKRAATPCLVYQQRALSLISDTADGSTGVTIAYEGRTFRHVTKTYLVMWNRGGAMRASQLRADDPLRFEVPRDAEIITARVMKSSGQANLSLDRAKAGMANAVHITFDELGPGEGGVAEILHTSSERFGALRGAITGMRGAPQSRGQLRPPFNPLPSQVPVSFKAIGYTAFVLTFGIGALLVLLSAFGPSLALVLGPHVGPVMSVIEGTADVIYAGLALIVLVQTRRRFPEDLSFPELVD